jgi:hypothetical protein
MSDTSSPAAPPSAPQTAAPNQSEVPINPLPVNSPNPVGPQAPQAPVGDLEGGKGRPQSRREAIQAAFDRANSPPPKAAKPAPKPAPPAAEARKGHNQPPEETPREGIDLKKRPSDQPRSERGTFAPRQQAASGQPGTPGHAQDAQNAQNAQQPAQRLRTLPEGAPYRDPPPRISERARQDWDNAPESVRGDYHRLHQEAEGIYRQYKSSHDAFQPIAPYHQMAQQQGTTLDKALASYVGIENKLRQDPIAGLDTIIYNLGMTDPQTGQRINLRDIAYHVLSQSPEQLKQVQQGNAQQAAQHQMGALHREISGLKQALHQMHTQAQFRQTRSAVDQFAEQHPRFDELGDLIENELKLGFDLMTAYRRAELLRPGNTAAQTRATPAQTRPIDQSISGSPDVAPSNGASRRNQKPVGRREAIQNAIRRVNGG